ncbi:MAG: hypothetical protein GC200_10290 [Tepidisphaera sp.]|nr:hypothetical protein [Tepidisphaera sp.]
MTIRWPPKCLCFFHCFRYNEVTAIPDIYAGRIEARFRSFLMSVDRRAIGALVSRCFAIILAIFICSRSFAQCPEGWLPGEQPSGFSNTVRASVLWDPDGSGPSPPVVVFGSAGDVPGLASRRIGYWDGAAWHPLGDGFNGAVMSLCVFNGDLYAGGAFTATASGTSLKYLARWNGAAWVQVGGASFNSSVNAMCVFNNELYVAGEFTMMNSVNFSHVARWNGSYFDQLGTGVNNSVFALAVHNNVLAIGGVFNVAGIYSVQHVVGWNGSSFMPLGSGLGTGTEYINAFATFNGSLYAGGVFQTIPGVGGTGNLARWDGASWSPLLSGADNGVNAGVRALTVFDGALYIGGDFSLAHGINSFNLAKWDGASFIQFGTSVQASVYTLVAANGSLYLGGQFVNVGSLSTQHICRYDGLGFHALGNSLAGTVYAITMFNNQIIAAGDIKYAGDTPVNSIAAFDGANWQPLGNGLGAGLGNTVFAATVFQGNLVVGGSFVTDGGAPSNHVAMWNGSTWIAMPDTGGSVHALCVYQDQLYAAGLFTSSLLRWTGTSWTPVVSNGVQNTVNTIVAYNGSLYVGGDFHFASGNPTNLNNVARVNGNTFEPVGAGFNGTVHSLVEFNDQLYAGGEFDAESTGLPIIGSVARWNGTHWESPVSGSGPSTHVLALLPFNAQLYATGPFTSLRDGLSAPCIALYNGATWRALSSGTSVAPFNSGFGNCLFESDNIIYAGGSFTQVGLNSPTTQFARWSPGGGSLTFTQSPQSVSTCTAGTASFSVQTSGSAALSYQWRKNGAPLVDGHGVTGTNSPILNLAYVVPDDAGAYDCVAFSACGPIACAPATLSVDSNCSQTCNPDFNNDGVADQGDVDSLINVIAGGACP